MKNTRKSDIFSTLIVLGLASLAAVFGGLLLGSLLDLHFAAAALIGLGIIGMIKCLSLSDRL